ncbi:MAG: hypothetical protein M1837_004517 [Sclerophora amabilis]|nr:MAG: hypothetical protein M1837_004517 [Sclerophora amabilis]
MGAGGFVEPLVVVLLFVGGTWINRYQGMSLADRPRRSFDHFTPGSCAPTDSESGGLLGEGEDERRASDHRSPSPSLLVSQEPHWRTRELRLWGFKSTVRSPNTTTFRGRALSRLLERFPFLVECWYWLLVYWTYQLGRAFTAVTLQQSTVHTARRHALQVVHLEQGLRIFSELEIQAFFMQYHTLMLWINRIYSFIHIPGTIFFLIWLYYYTITRNRLQGRQSNKDIAKVDGSPGGPGLYEARRRTMAVCNLLAFIVFTLWPCMPPRLLSEPTAEGPDVTEAQKYGFVDTVHGEGGESSVWTQNRFCNQYGKRPSFETTLL